MSKVTIPLASLRFEGPRFENHALDVDCVGELAAYKRLVLECAKALWFRNHPDRERLPKGFEDELVIRFSEIRDGSALVPLTRVLLQDQAELSLGVRDEFDVAASLIDDAIASAALDELLPKELPANVIPFFEEFGRSLRSDEVVHVRARNSAHEVAYTAQARKRLAEWTMSSYEDRIDVVGEVSMANVRGGSFALVVSDRQGPVTGKFTDAQEAEILDALRSHKTARVRVIGTGEFSAADRTLRRILQVDDVSVVVGTEPAWVEAAKPIWERVREIGASVPDALWEQVPPDLATRLDHYLYPRRDEND
ncbi:MAG TPA: hypothetical protein VLW55_28590 [Burkholderiaceae bacterium]|nr:hypothetical protein [Burkholderiaceae bacterium]